MAEGKKQEGAPMWIVTFADLSTLMLTFFVLLLSFANMDIVKFKEMLGSVKGAFGVKVEVIGKTVPFISGEEVFEDKKKKDEKGTMASADKAELKQSHQKIKSLVKESEIKNNVTVQKIKDQIRVRVDGGTFFVAGSAKMKRNGFKLLKGLVRVIKGSDYSLTVEGHTDNVPIRTRKFPSNWELSGIRATTVLRYLLTTGIPEDRLRAIGYADTRPVADNITPEGRARNRRVEFILKKITSSQKEAPQG